MKTRRFFIIAAAAASLAAVATSCDKENNNPGSGSEQEVAFIKLKSIETTTVEPDYGQAEKSVYEFNWIEGGNRLASFKYDVYAFVFDEESEGYSTESYHDRKQETIFTWKEDGSADYVRTDEAWGSNSGQWWDQGTSSGSLAFNEDGYLQQNSYKKDKYSYKQTYEYEGKYIAKIDLGGDVYTFNWENDDLVSVKSNSATFTFTYSSEVNPITKGVNPLFLDILGNNEFQALGIAGLFPAHLPEKCTLASMGGDMVWSFTYEKDAQGRLSKMKVTFPEMWGGISKTYSFVY